MKISIELSTPFKIIYTKSRRRSRTLSPDYRFGEHERAHSSTYTSKGKLRASPSPIRETHIYLQPHAYESAKSEQRGRSPRVGSQHSSPNHRGRDIDKSRSSEKDFSRHHREAHASSSRNTPHQYVDKQGRGRQRSYSNVERGEVLRSCLKKAGTPSRGRSRSRVRFNDTPIPSYVNSPSPRFGTWDAQENRGRQSGYTSTGSQLLSSSRQRQFAPPRAPSTCGSCDDQPTSISHTQGSKRYKYFDSRSYAYPVNSAQGYSASRHTTYDYSPQMR